MKDSLRRKAEKHLKGDMKGYRKERKYLKGEIKEDADLLKDIKRGSVRKKTSRRRK